MLVPLNLVVFLRFWSSRGRSRKCELRKRDFSLAPPLTWLMNEKQRPFWRLGDGQSASPMN
jgi:hypothetical protein